MNHLAKQMLELALPLSLIAVSVDAAVAPPRLWEVTGKNEQGANGKFYILPVTHDGLDVEHDDYFYKTVVPIAMKADVFLHEASLMLPVEAPACKVPLLDTKKNHDILEEAHAEVERTLFDLIPPVAAKPGDSEQHREQSREASRIFARSLTDNLSEYGLIISMRIYYHAMQTQHPERLPKMEADFGSKPEIADYLAYHRNKGEKKASMSIDEKHDLFDAYCNIGASRALYLQREVARFDPSKAVYLTKTEIARFSVGFVDSIQKGYLSEVFPSSTDGYDKQIVCERNEKWLAKMRNSLGVDVRFYALGMAHVLQPSLQNQNRCDGLLQRLRHEGFTVTLVR